jgi:hypothetical protein
MLGRLLPKRAKSWLRGFDPSYHRLVAEVDGRNRRIGQLEEELRTLRRRLDILENRERVTTYADLSDEDFRRLSTQGLFVVGNARSGTTILWDCLNLSGEIYLLGEANLYARRDLGNFVDHLQRQHAQWKNERGKGTFVPPPLTTEAGGLATLARLGEHFRYVGEKVAFGLSAPGDDGTQQEAFFQFHARYFFYSIYFLIVRHPADCLRSMLRMWPHLSPRDCLRSWLHSLKILLDVYAVFPRVYLVFYENLRPEMFARVNAILGTDIQVPPLMIRPQSKPVSAGDEVGWPDLEPLRPFAERCAEIYWEVRGAFSAETLLVKPAVPRGQASPGLLDVLRRRIADLVCELRVADDAPAQPPRTPASPPPARESLWEPAGAPTRVDWRDGWLGQGEVMPPTKGWPINKCRL